MTDHSIRQAIANVIPENIFMDASFEECSPAEQKAFLRCADAILALTSASTPTIDDIPSCGSENDYRRASGSDAVAGTPLMQAAQNAQKVVDGWSDSKREYADRAILVAPCNDTSPLGTAENPCPRCHYNAGPEGAERYWEARWRDEKAENERLRERTAAYKGQVEAGAAEIKIARARLDYMEAKYGAIDWDATVTVARTST